MKYILLLILSITLFTGYSQDTISILFIGNSFTNGNSTIIDNVNTGTLSIPYKFKQLAVTAGFNVDVEMYCPNGIYVYDYNGQTGHANRTETATKINSKSWDYVYVQDNQGSYVWSEGYFASTVANANIALYNKIKANNSCTRVFFYAGQALQGGLPSSYWNQGGLNLTYDNTQNCNTRIYKNVKYLNNHAGFNEIVTPIGLAWNKYISDGHSDSDLFFSDGSHPSNYGTYLAAAVVFSQVCKTSPVNINWNADLSGSVAQYLRQIAWDIINDVTIFQETHLSDYTPTIASSNNILTTSNSYSSYQWYQNLSPISSTNSSSYSYNQTDYYHVEVIDGNGCKYRSFNNHYDFSTLIDNSTVNEFGIDYSNGKVIITNMSGGNLKLINITGTILMSKKIKGYKHVELLDRFTAGTYVVIAEHNQKKYIKKIIVL